MRDILKWFADLLWPLSCLGCARRDMRLCGSCLSSVDTAPAIRRRPFPAVDRLVAGGTLRSPLLERAVWHFKYRNAPDLAEPLGDWLATAGGTAGILPARNTIVVPIPLHPRRLRERGYNQAELLAGRFATLALLPMHPHALARTRHTAHQVGTPDRLTRLENMRNAFACVLPELVRGRSVMLVDDVCTTGATLQAAAAALKDAGARTVIGVVLAQG